MRTSIAYLVLLVAACSTGCGRKEPPHEPGAPTAERASVEGPGSHDEHAAHRTAPALAAGQLWPTDEPLRAAMQRIRLAVERAGVAYEKQQLSSSDAQLLAATVEENVTYMIANCKLAPGPDAALHGLIGRMMSAAAALKKDAAWDEGVPQLGAALHDYKAAFDDKK